MGKGEREADAARKGFVELISAMFLISGNRTNVRSRPALLISLQFQSTLCGQLVQRYRFQFFDDKFVLDFLTFFGFNFSD